MIFGGKLRNKIFLTMALVSIVPIFIAAFLSLYSIDTSHRADVANLEGALISQKYAEIKNFLDGITGMLQLRFEFEEDKDVLDLAAKKSLLKLLLKENQPLEEVAFVNLEGQETVRFNRFNMEGVPKEELRNQSQSEKFLVAKSGRDYTGPVHYTLKGPIMPVASPSRNKNGVVVTVITGEVNLRNIQKIIETSKLGESGYLYLFDHDGFLIGGGGNFKSEAVLSSLKDIGVARAVLRGSDFLGAEGQQRYRNFFGDMVIAAAKFMPEYKWGLVAEWPTKEADAVVRDLLYKNLIVSFSVVVAVILISILLATLIVRPVRKLEDGTELVAKGKFDQPVIIKTGDELEELGAAFNRMMAGLKQLQELKDEFVFIAAHELRTPVAAMKGYLSLILDGIAGPITEKTKDFIQKVVKANQRLIQLVNDLLEVSRSEAGRLTIKVAPVDIVEPIKTVLQELRPLADEKSIKMSYEPPPGLPRVLADADRVKEIMVNLVGNAIKYTLGASEVLVSHDIQGGYLLTYVKDGGIGISKEAQKRLFEKFYRVPDEKIKGITGTGLGLFIVKELVLKMNGKVGVSSEEGKGSIFAFSLPIAQ